MKKKTTKQLQAIYLNSSTTPEIREEVKVILLARGEKKGENLVPKLVGQGKRQVPELIGKNAEFLSRHGQQKIKGEIVNAFVDKRDEKTYVAIEMGNKVYHKLLTSATVLN